ncbi:ATP-binding protein [Peptococcaceae bacterium]|nr:ATP-binding protein [Peptococcaceae bacterium]
MINLIDNAIRAIEKEGKIIIEINDKDKKVELCVIDTGCGIPENEIEFIWERFYKKSRKISHQR